MFGGMGRWVWVLWLVWAGCGGPEATGPAPWPLEAFPESPDAMEGVSEERIELGRMLFYDPVLSVDHQTACATCHSEIWGMGDGLARGIGHGAGLDAGPRRAGPNHLRRNSPSVYNLAWRESFLWDGRVATLEDQAVMPIVDRLELGSSENAVIAELATIPVYAELFSEAFPNDPNVTVENLASAIAAFERTIVSNRSAYDGFAEGRFELLGEPEVEGMFLFADMGCAECHVPPLFGSETFHDRNVPEVDGIEDFGREEFTELPEDRDKFRTPSLRNLEATEPYFHNGSVKEMLNAIRHELEQSGRPFTDEDVKLIRTFIHNSLRDESRNPIRPFEVPSGLPLPIDPAGPG